MRIRYLDYNLAWDALTVTASSEDAEFPASNLTRIHRSAVWRSAAGVTTASVVFDLGTAEALDSVAIFWDAVRAVPLTNAATVTVQANATNVWGAPAVSEVLTVNHDLAVAAHFFTAAESYRYWRVLIADAGNPDARVEIGKVVLASATTLARLPSQAFNYRRRTGTRVMRTAYGHAYADLYPQMRALELSYRAAPYADLQALEGMYQRLDVITPLVVALDYETDESTAGQFLLYGTFEGEIAATRSVPGHYDLALTFTEAA